MPAAFSRLQLAAALLEYDNDPDNPDAPCRSAQDSAIFAHLRRNPAARPGITQRKSDYLGVSLPSETGSLGGRESAIGTRRSRASRASFDALRNPFGAEDAFDESEDGLPHEDEIEVDLTSWGLDAFMPKEKSKLSKGKDKQTYDSPTVTSVPSHTPLTNRDVSSALPRRALGSSRTMSLGGGLDFVHARDSSPLIHAGPSDPRRRTVSSPLDLSGVEPSVSFPQRRRAGSEILMNSNYQDRQSVPFPTSTIPFSQPLNDLRQTHERTYSRATIGSRAVLDEDRDGVRERRQSNVSLGTVMRNDDNPFVLDAPTHISKFDPKAATHARTTSNASMGTRMLLDHDQISIATGAPPERERRFSTTRELLRPKVLVMPSPLQPIGPTMPPPDENSTTRGGFQITTDGPPLPPGARSSRRASQTLTMFETAPPKASNPFTPNPLLDLSLSQKTFRDTLTAGGQRDPYVDIDGLLPRATQDGEQVELDPIVHEMETPLPIAPVETDNTAPSRPAGKLYGKSLIDDLENRKAQMRAKQRVFTGDQRPSMMAREQTRSSTLIDPASLAIRPQSQHMSSFGPQPQTLSRRNSSNIKPLLNFDDDSKVIPVSPSQPLPSSRSVFGVDTLWEREMAKLREIQAREREEEARRIQEQDMESKQGKKKKKKGKKSDVPAGELEQAAFPEARISVEPPVLPDIERAPRRVPRPVDDGEDDQSDSDASDGLVPAHVTIEPAGWHAGSSEDEDTGPRRTVGVGLRYPSKRRRKVAPKAEHDSDEDTPLAAVIRKPRKQDPWLQSPVDSDEEEPLSMILQKTKSKLSVLHDGEDDEDNEPLGLRASRIPPPVSTGMDNEDDDDKPLAFHPDQQRRTQYIMAQQQQHQQQLMMQAQLQNSMFFNSPSAMGSGFFSNPMVNPMMMMQPPITIPSPPPLRDEAKFGRVDRWRRDVAVEGEP
ncbi:hypothetical protein BDQ17DRAFT_1349492 [Cyathus striatus]|nr:hypothetical protein BDQ17DRAFT_1349492 [Cyathus striatus]